MKTFKWETTLIAFIKKYYVEIVIVLLFIMGLMVRYAARNVLSSDMRIYLLPWYDEIKSNGGLASLAHQVGDYNMPYQAVIALMTYLPIKPIVGYKLFSVIFDLVGAIAAALLVYEITHSKLRAKGCFIIIWLSLGVMFNSAYWGQCDSIYTSFILFSIYALMKRKYPWSFILLGIAFSWKLQTIFVLPVYLLVYIKRKEFSLVNFLIIPMTMIINSFPALLSGRKISEVFTIYFNQVGAFKGMTSNYPNIWAIIPGDKYYNT